MLDIPMRSHTPPRRRALLLSTTTMLLVVTLEVFSGWGWTTVGQIVGDYLAHRFGMSAWGWVSFMAGGILVPLICCYVLIQIIPWREIGRWTGRELVGVVAAAILTSLSLPMGSAQIYHHLIPIPWFISAWSVLALIWMFAFPLGALTVSAVWMLRRPRRSTTR
jgi:hypothetical protein